VPSRACGCPEFAEKTKGRLAPGQWADFVVLDRHVTMVKPDEILHARVLRTVVSGKTVFLLNSSGHPVSWKTDSDPRIIE
jgi:imidazolonepropionase-like amidohydrolase